MSKYIDREALLKQLEGYCSANCGHEPGEDALCLSCFMCDAIGVVEDQTAADVKPVVRGEWIPAPAEYEGETPNIWWKCSVCGQKIYSETERDRKEFHTFCSRCGADMREG